MHMRCSNWTRMTAIRIWAQRKMTTNESFPLALYQVRQSLRGTIVTPTTVPWLPHLFLVEPFYSYQNWEITLHIICRSDKPIASQLYQYSFMTLTYERLKHDITKYCFVGQFSGDDRLLDLGKDLAWYLKCANNPVFGCSDWPLAAAGGPVPSLCRCWIWSKSKILKDAGKAALSCMLVYMGARARERRSWEIY